MGELLEKAKCIARKMHNGQIDKVGEPYIEHLERVADELQSEDEKIVAWLHDIVEDTEFSLSDLKHGGFPDYIVKAINSISKRKNERNEDYLARVKANLLAKAVKLKDLEDNLNPERSKKLNSSDKARLTKKYRFALEYLRKPDEEGYTKHQSPGSV
jgi:hypothetical protein